MTAAGQLKPFRLFIQSKGKRNGNDAGIPESQPSLPDCYLKIKKIIIKKILLSFFLASMKSMGPFLARKARTVSP